MFWEHLMNEQEVHSSLWDIGHISVDLWTTYSIFYEKTLLKML
jgi:hypothetical protein